MAGRRCRHVGEDHKNGLYGPRDALGVWSDGKNPHISDFSPALAHQSARAVARGMRMVGASQRHSVKFGEAGP